MFKFKYDKIIYLDCNVIVEGDLKDYYNINLEENILAGVSDIEWFSWFYKSTEYRLNYYTKLGINGNNVGYYIDTVSLLINLKPLKNYEEYFIAFFNSYEITYLND